MFTLGTCSEHQVDDDAGGGRDTKSSEWGEHPVLIFTLILGILTILGDFTRFFCVIVSEAKQCVRSYFRAFCMSGWWLW